jgi:hypothetical protein
MTLRVSSDQPESEVKTPELFSGEEGQVELEKLWAKDAVEALRLWASQVCDKDPSAEQFVRRSAYMHLFRRVHGARNLHPRRSAVASGRRYAAV